MYAAQRLLGFITRRSRGLDTSNQDQNHSGSHPSACIGRSCSAGKPVQAHSRSSQAWNRRCDGRVGEQGSSPWEQWPEEAVRGDRGHLSRGVVWGEAGDGGQAEDKAKPESPAKCDTARAEAPLVGFSSSLDYPNSSFKPRHPKLHSTVEPVEACRGEAGTASGQPQVWSLMDVHPSVLVETPRT